MECELPRSKADRSLLEWGCRNVCLLTGERMECELDMSKAKEPELELSIKSLAEDCLWACKNDDGLLAWTMTMECELARSKADKSRVEDWAWACKNDCLVTGTCACKNDDGLLVAGTIMTEFELELSMGDDKSLVEDWV
jgi:hypothetical protein